MRERGLPKPWTTDPILQQYRFCNVYRELDTQTQWYADNWRDPNATHRDIWFTSLVFRLVNWHETAEEIGLPLPWKPERFIKAMHRRRDAKEKVFSAAYIISTNGVAGDKAEYLAKNLTDIWAAREHIRHRAGELLDDFHARLVNCMGVGSFIGAQVIADAKYTPLFIDARDWWTFAASGPGSRRGLNRIMGRSVDSPWMEETWRATLVLLHHEVNPLLKAVDMAPLHAQDLQNCLCEFDKYERVRLGEGRPKAKYNGGK